MRTRNNIVHNILIFIFSFLYLATLNIPVSATSFAIKYPASEVSGIGPCPYNLRVIDNHIYAGGHPLNPGTNFGNTDEQTLTILNFLKSKNIKTVIDLENTQYIQKRYESLLSQAGLKRLHIPMSATKVPNKKEWKEIKSGLGKPAYIHCMWGADRTGAIIGRYLVESKGYSPNDAFLAVVKGGSHAGPLGGLKTGLGYGRLKDFILYGPKD